MRLPHRCGPLMLVALAACGDNLPAAPDAAPPVIAPTAHSSSIALSADGAMLYVVNADSDSISIVDASSRVLVAEVALGAPPAVDGANNFAPTVMPRALALSPDDKTLYVTGQRSGRVYAIDLATRMIQSVPVGSEPVGVLTAGDGSIYVACSQDRTIVKLAPTLVVAHTQAVASAPWALGWSPADGSLVATLFFGPDVVALDPDSLAVRESWSISDTLPRSDPRLAHGQVRGLYDVAARPGTAELWIAHALLGIDTAQPELDFERTAFPALSILQNGTYATTLSIDADDVPGIDGSFGDIVSGPHAIAFTHDGAIALVVDTNSEDVLAVGQNRVEAALARPLPGHMPEGIVISPDDQLAYVDERNTGDIAIVRISHGTTGVTLAAEGSIPRLASDPMPPELRTGQHLFYSANSDELAITKNHWIACATCHMEGRSDAVTWKFAQGPRDTPTNAGGMLGTGFLFRTADRNQVQDYWHTINVEQGGAFDPVNFASQLDAIAAYVNHGIPLPIPPTTDPVKVAAGAAIFARADVGCSGCHAGARFTDSGTGNPTLDLAGTITLHDVETCNTGDFPDVAHTDLQGHPRAGCLFDTPSLSGVWSSPPYLHDGSAHTLHDVLENTRGRMGNIDVITSAQEDDLLEYLKSL